MRSQNGIFTEIMTIAPNAGTTTDKFYEAGDIPIVAREEGARNPRLGRAGLGSRPRVGQTASAVRSPRKI